MQFNKWQDIYSGHTYSSGYLSAVKVLIIINIVVFILVHIFPNFPWFALFGLVPSFVFSRFMFWQLFTHLFLHAGLWHLVINMLMLWMFGSIIEDIWGRNKFLFYYFLTGIGAGICSIIFAFNSLSAVVGASGAIFGLLVAYAVMFPESIILLFFIFPMKMKHAVIILAAINLLGALSTAGSGIAYIAHLSGGVFGYLYLKNGWIKMKLAHFDFSLVRKKWKKRTNDLKQKQINDLDKQVDLILDKISRNGINSLTKQEREILEKKSKLI